MIRNLKFQDYEIFFIFPELGIVFFVSQISSDFSRISNVYIVEKKNLIDDVLSNL